jgi:hypothetical protein
MIRWVEASREHYRGYLQAQETLARQPENPAANLMAGKYHCLVKDNWRRGLSLILKAKDPLLSPLAEAELSQPTEAAGMIALADRWWEASVKVEESVARGCLNRAAQWYRRALPNASGFTRAKIQRRLDELKQANP